MKRILIVDDDERVRNICIRSFVQFGFVVYWASNAQQAIGFLITEPIDLILLDINMPRIDGKKLFDVIKYDRFQSKIIVSSAYPIDKQRVMIPYADAYYDKSEGPLKLLEKVNYVMSRN